ncbi:MAG: hypothetical protein IBJ03_07625 [Gemmatimonadaceae bacterium]|nr:hypothetical protein [Gemmatimonadaceae bacterium]
MRTSRLIIGSFILIASAACGGESKPSVQFSADRREPTMLSADDVQITSTDGAMILAVVGDSVVMQLSDSLRQSVKADVEKNTGESGALGKMIGSAVSAAVSTAMGFSVTVPAEKVENLRYEDGNLRFNVDGGSHFTIRSDGRSKGNESGGTFSEPDAQRFIEAVHAAQARRTAK